MDEEELRSEIDALIEAHPRYEAFQLRLTAVVETQMTAQGELLRPPIRSAGG